MEARILTAHGGNDRKTTKAQTRNSDSMGIDGKSLTFGVLNNATKKLKGNDSDFGGYLLDGKTPQVNYHQRSESLRRFTISV
jgi:hypothetical protein